MPKDMQAAIAYIWQGVKKIRKFRKELGHFQVGKKVRKRGDEKSPLIQVAVSLEATATVSQF